MFWHRLGELFAYDPKHPMLFNSLAFLAFFTVFIFFYGFLYEKRKARLIYVIAFSLFFYYKSSGVYLLLFIGTILLDYWMALRIEEAQGKKRKWLLLASIGISLSLLAYFKYTGFLLANLNAMFGSHFALPDIFLPIGISFYTFQSLSYVIDVYRGEIKANRNFLDYAFYMSFFPHLVAGPIVRAKDFLPQVRQHLRITRSQVDEGLYRIAKGLIKKALIADYIAQYADLVYYAPSHYSGFENLMAMYAYTVQIYFDFSGYSDMAIGLALLVGYRLKENFDAPYRSLNITEFWRRWHISLSGWLRDYVYIPMGGNRKGPVLQYVFLLLTMLIGGLWHGPNWKFVLWGGAHGLALAGHKLFTQRYGKKLPNRWWINLISGLLTFHFVAILWVFFRAKSTTDALTSLQLIFTDTHWNWLAPFVEVRVLFSVLFVLALLLILLPQTGKLEVMSRFRSSPLLVKACIYVLVVQAIIQMSAENVQPFIYFQF